MTAVEFIFKTVYLFLFGIFICWWFIWRPQQVKQNSQQELIGSLKKNDEVIVMGGVYGRVFAINPDFITVEIAANVRIKVTPDSISIVKQPESKAKV